MFFRNSLLSLLTAASVNAALDEIVISGNKFFFKTNGTQFYIKGVAYQQDVGSAGTGAITGSGSNFVDPLASPDNCKRDVPFLQQLGANLIRTYAIDPSQDHSECMALLEAAGIYVISDLGSPQQSINQDTPAWDTALFERYTSVVDALQNYTNVIGFFGGNEVTNQLNNTEASAFVKAAVRDTKAYIKAKGYHSMGVGYAADDDATVRHQVADFMNCGDNPDDAIDFWGYNIYEWCGESTFVTSGYSDRTTEFQNYTVPAFFAEYGCNTPTGGKPDAAARPWQEVGTLYGPQMNDVFSGGIAYEYFEEVNDFGLVTIDGNTVSTLADFPSLASQLASVTPTGVNSASFKPTNTVVRDCPTIQANFWQATSSPLPPSPNADLCSCMLQSLTCTTKSGISADAVGSLLNEVCGSLSSAVPGVCDGISTNATTGKYGAYSMCTGAQQLAFAFNTYYNGVSSSEKSTACDFGGNATTQSSTKASGTCATLLSQAGTAGTGSVSSSPTSGGGSSGTSGSASTSSSKGAASGNFVPGLGSGWSTFVAFAVYVSGAAAVGASMVLL